MSDKNSSDSDSNVQEKVTKEFKNKVLKWLSIDDKIREHRQQTKLLTKEKKENETFILSFLIQMILSLFTNTFVIDLSVVEEGPDFGKSILWPAVTIVERIMKNINNRKTKSVMDDIPPSILILFCDLKSIFFLPNQIIVKVMNGD